MAHGKTFDRNGDFNVTAYFAQLRRQYQWAREHGFAPLETDAVSQRAKACIDMTTGQMADCSVILR